MTDSKRQIIENIIGLKRYYIYLNGMVVVEYFNLIRLVNLVKCDT